MGLCFCTAQRRTLVKLHSSNVDSVSSVWNKFNCLMEGHACMHVCKHAQVHVCVLHVEPNAQPRRSSKRIWENTLVRCIHTCIVCTRKIHSHIYMHGPRVSVWYMCVCAKGKWESTRTGVKKKKHKSGTTPVSYCKQLMIRCCTCRVPLGASTLHWFGHQLVTEPMQHFCACLPYVVHQPCNT